MARRFFVLVLAAGFVLAGCDAPDDQGSGDGNKADKKVRVESPAKNESRPDKEPAEKQPSNKEQADAGTKEASDEPERASKPEPAPKPKPGSAKRAKPRPEPAVSASATASAPAGNYDATVTISRVVDGDTIEISPAINGVEDVRLIGMDTPETVDPGEEVEPLGPEASAFATDELTGQSVGLEFDVEEEDQYGRLLAYVYLGEEMFNEVLVEEGYAQTYPYDPNTRYEGRLAVAQEGARAEEIGIWGLSLDQQCLLADRGNGIGEGTPGCSGATASASSSASSSATASSSSSASAGSGGTAPAAPTSGGDIDCDQVNGPIPTPPGDPDGLDGDGDGLACE